MVDGVGVHEAESADARSGEVEVRRGAEAAEADDKGSVPEIIGRGKKERESGRQRERKRERVGRGIDSLWLWRLLLGRGWR